MRETRPGVWALTVITDHDRVFQTIIGNCIDAERELARLTAQHGQPPTTLDALVAIHHAYLSELGRSPSTVRRYMQLWRTWLAPVLGTIRPDEVRRTDIERALTLMHDAGQSARSIHQAAVVLNTTFTWARERGLAQANPVIGCELPNGATITCTRHR
jgi:hypothetical protein